MTFQLMYRLRVYPLTADSVIRDLNYDLKDNDATAATSVHPVTLPPRR